MDNSSSAARAFPPDDPDLFDYDASGRPPRITFEEDGTVLNVGLRAKPFEKKIPKDGALGLHHGEPIDNLPPSRPIKRIRALHHQVAKELALGKKPVEVCGLFGISANALREWQKDPAFEELIASYRAHDDEVTFDHRKALATMGLVATQVLTERLVDKPDEFSTRELVELSAHAYDRSEAPKMQTNINVGPGANAPPTVKIEFVDSKLSPAAQIIDGKIVDENPPQEVAKIPSK